MMKTGFNTGLVLRENRVELVGQCVDDNGKSTIHRIWITRFGDVLTPDHQARYDHEKVLVGLGGNLTNFCALLTNANKMARGSLTVATKPPSFPQENIQTWEYTHETVWTQQSQMTANTALFGVPIYHPLSPVFALKFTQLFQRFNIILPAAKDWEDKLHILANPTNRTAGWSKTRPVTIFETTQLLETGIDPLLVPDIAAFNIPPTVVRQAAQTFTRYGIPHGLLLTMATLIPAEKISQMLTKITNLNAHTFPLDVMRLDVDRASSPSHGRRSLPF